MSEPTREGPVTPLIDSPQDGAVEQRGWVPVADAADEAAAIKVMGEMCPPESVSTYIVTGRSWHRPCLHLPNLDAAPDAWFTVEKGGPERHEDHQGVWSEYLPWEECEQGDEGAVEFWTLEPIEEECCEKCEGDGAYYRLADCTTGDKDCACNGPREYVDPCPDCEGKGTRLPSATSPSKSKASGTGKKRGGEQ